MGSLHYFTFFITLHPALHRGRIPISNGTFNGTICPVSVVGRPRIFLRDAVPISLLLEDDPDVSSASCLLSIASSVE